MTNLETLKQFNEIVKPLFEKYPDYELDFTDLLYRADSWSREVNSVPLLMKSNDRFIATLKEYIEYMEGGE